MSKVENHYPREIAILDEKVLKELTEHLGPHPRSSLVAMVDLGLSNADISRYYRTEPETVIRLLNAYDIVRDL